MQTASPQESAAPQRRARGLPALAETSEVNRDQAQHGLTMIKQAIVNLLCRKRRGMTNAEICRALGLAGDKKGSGRNMLSWSVLAMLVQEGKLQKSGHYYFLT